MNPNEIEFFTSYLPTSYHGPRTFDAWMKHLAENERFIGLVRHVREHGLLMPVFLHPEGHILTGHYRLWAAIAAGLDFVEVVTANSCEDVARWIAKRSQSQRAVPARCRG